MVQEKEFCCDCPDFAGGMTCKHILAVRLRRGDRVLARLARQLRGDGEETGVDLFALWYDPAAIRAGELS